MTDNRSEKLNSIIKDMGSVIVAFSGGVDSSFLLHRASSLLRDKVMAVTIKTPYIPEKEIKDAIEFTGRYGIRHSILSISLPETIKNNPLQRCYLCKKTLFNQLIDFAKKNNFHYVIDGSNADDTNEFRPGMKALEELNIRSPLLESGLTKSDIRKLSRMEGLETWDKPALACLLTRIPHDTEIDTAILKMIEAGEDMLSDLGFPGTRVRIHGNLARIECLPDFIDRMLQKPVRELIVSGMKKIGFRYISLDLEGYRTGSYNIEMKET